MDVSAGHLRVARETLADARARVELRKFDGLASIDALPRSQEDTRQDWEMHCLPQPVICQAFRRNGFALLEVREDGALANGISHVFFAMREGEYRHTMAG